jgi:hypothetical protein
MWCDDFDMDLLKIFPSTPQMLGDLANMPLWTVGGETDSKLNHPCVWNSHGAFVWTDTPILPRDKHGWFNVGGCVGDAPIVPCTLLEFLRDQWVHEYAAIVLPSRRVLPAPDMADFQDIMYDIRGWKKSQNIERSRQGALRWLLRCQQIMETERAVIQ